MRRNCSRHSSSEAPIEPAWASGSGSADGAPKPTVAGSMRATCLVTGCVFTVDLPRSPFRAARARDSSRGPAPDISSGGSRHEYSENDDHKADSLVMAVVLVVTVVRITGRDSKV